MKNVLELIKVISLVIIAICSIIIVRRLDERISVKGIVEVDKIWNTVDVRGNVNVENTVDVNVENVVDVTW